MFLCPTLTNCMRLYCREFGNIKGINHHHEPEVTIYFTTCISTNVHLPLFTIICLHTFLPTRGINKLIHWTCKLPSQQTHYALMTSLLCQNDTIITSKLTALSPRGHICRCEMSSRKTGITQWTNNVIITSFLRQKMARRRSNVITTFSYTLSREYRVVRNRYSRLLFTSEDRLCANLRV